MQLSHPPGCLWFDRLPGGVVELRAEIEPFKIQAQQPLIA